MAIRVRAGGRTEEREDEAAVPVPAQGVAMVSVRVVGRDPFYQKINSTRMWTNQADAMLHNCKPTDRNSYPSDLAAMNE